MKRRGATRHAGITVLALLLLGLATCRSQPEDDEALTGQPAALPDDIEVADASSGAVGGGSGGSGGGGGIGGDGADTYSDDWEDPLPGDHPNGDDTIVDTSDDVEADVPPGNAASRGVIPGNRKPGDLVPGEEEGEAEGGAGRGVKGGAEMGVRAQAEGEAEGGGAEEWEAQEEAAEEEPENPWIENGRGEGSSAAVAQAQDYQPGGEDGFAEGLSGKAEAQAQDDQAGGGNGFAEGQNGKEEAEEEPSSDWPAGEAGESAEQEVGDESESGTATIQEADNGYGDTGGTYERNVPAQGGGGAEQPAQGEAWTFEEDQPGQGGREQGGAMGGQVGGGEPGEGEGEGGAGDERGDNSDYFFHGQDPDEEEWQKRKHNWQNAGPNSDSNDPNAADDANGPSDYNEAEQTQTSGNPADANPDDGNPDDELFSDNNPSSSDEAFPDSSNPAAQDAAAVKTADSATTGSGSEGSEPAALASNSYSEGYQKMAGGQISAEGILGIVLGVTLGAGLCLLVVCVCWVRQRNINRAKESEAMTEYVDDSSEEEDEEGLEEAADTALMGGIVGAHRALDIEAQQALKSSKH